MLRVVDNMIAQATSNQAFRVKLPLLNTSIRDVIGIASVFTSALFEFFVMVEPIEDRDELLKSFSIKGGAIDEIATTEEEYAAYNGDFELYVLREDLTVNPIAGRAEALRNQALQEGGLCSIQIHPYAVGDTTESYLNEFVSSMSGSHCDVDLCVSTGCHVCTENSGEVDCAPCASSDDCDGLSNVVDYRFCDCDLVVTVDNNDKFMLYTGKNNLSLFFMILALGVI